LTRECLTAIPGAPISGKRVARELTAHVGMRGKPRMIVSDNGTEFTFEGHPGLGKDQRVEWRYITPGRPAHQM
jgi:putative transposase